MLAGALAAVLMQAAAPTVAAPEFVVHPVWDRRPTGDDIAKAYPKAASSALLAGVARTTCTLTEAGRLTDCAVAAEDPSDAGFGSAAVSLTPLFRMKPLDADG